MFSGVYSLAALFVVSVAAVEEVYIEGKCPHVHIQENFDVPAYAGKWYEASKYPNIDELKGKCAYAEYTPAGEGVKVKNANVVDGVQTYVEGTAKLADDANGSGKLLVTFQFGPVVRTAPLWILSTDYKNYSVAYTCRYIEDQQKSKVFVWVLSRSKSLEGAAKTAVDGVFKAANLDTSKLIPSDQSEEACKFEKTFSITRPS